MCRPQFDEIKQLARGHLAAAGGNVTIIFSMFLLVVMGIAGAAIDYSRLIEQRTVYAAAADAAALAAISSAREAERNGVNAGGISATAQKAALAAWKVNIATSTLHDQNPPAITVKKKAQAWTATIAYDTQSPTSFMSLLGVKSMRLAGTATASTTLDNKPTYWNLFVVVDTSSSMGIGATQADMNALKANPNIGCMFACHWADYSKGQTDSASIAKAAGIKLRIDIVDDAVGIMVADMKTVANGGNISAALWGLNNTINQLVPLTTKLDSVKDFTLSLFMIGQSQGNTNYYSTFQTMTDNIGKAGGGTSAAEPKKAVFIVTDGIHDTTMQTSNGSHHISTDHWTGTVDPAFCKQMKDNGVLVGVLYIDYIVPQGYEGYISPFKTDILPSMQSCATDGMFYNATSPDAINKAMQDMLKTAMGYGTVRLTN